MTELNTWESVAGNYGLDSDDLLYILERGYNLETVKDICEYWLYCYTEGHELETLREADRAYKIADYQAELMDEMYKEVP